MRKLTRQAFNDRMRQYRRASALPIGFFSVVCLAGVVLLQFGDTERAYVPGAIALGAFALFAVWYGYTYLPKRHGLGCPACGKSMLRYRGYEKLIKRGRCPRCGATVFADNNAADGESLDG